jgi:hypothetical protein
MKWVLNLVRIWRVVRARREMGTESGWLDTVLTAYDKSVLLIRSKDENAICAWWESIELSHVKLHRVCPLQKKNVDVCLVICHLCNDQFDIIKNKKS